MIDQILHRSLLHHGFCFFDLLVSQCDCDQASIALVCLLGQSAWEYVHSCIASLLKNKGFGTTSPLRPCRTQRRPSQCRGTGTSSHSSGMQIAHAIGRLMISALLVIWTPSHIPLGYTVCQYASWRKQDACRHCLTAICDMRLGSFKLSVIGFKGSRKRAAPAH